jgi:hypothetical protein
VTDEGQRNPAPVGMVPPEVVQAARAAFAARTTDAEVAFLVQESIATPAGQPPVALLTFESGQVVIELQVHGGPDRDLTGRLLPRGPSPVRSAPAVIQVEYTGGPTTVQTDEHGRFVAAGLAAGPMRLLCRLPHPAPPVVSDWVAI